MEEKSKILKEGRMGNCNRCEAPALLADLRRRNRNGGDILLWCPDCDKKFNRKKVKLRKKGD